MTMREAATEYKFDVVAVATYTITTAAGPAAARAAADSLDAFEPDYRAADWDAPEDAVLQVTCVTPRGLAALVETTPELADPDEPDVPLSDPPLEEPLTGDWRERLKSALDEADAALGGDSNDAEHDALYLVRQTIAGLLGIDTEPPSPDDDEEDEAAGEAGSGHG
jgi:hypothetical protein